MSNEIIENDESWKIDLRSKFIEIFSGNTDKKYFEDVDYYYMNYAPATLFKYYGDNLDRLESVANNEMWYSAPINFNDVFDCDISISEKELFNSVLQMCPDKRGIRAGSPIWKELRRTMKREVESLKEVFETGKKATGISCLSESYDSLLMWAHYANNHCGICVEYELMEINKQLGFSPVPVIYSSDKVCMRTLNQQTIEKDSQRLFIESLTSKSPDWNYEKEWRIIRDQGACGDKWSNTDSGALLEMIYPSSITLGCTSKAEFEKNVHDYCKENHVNLYKMEKDLESYQLHRNSVLSFKD